MPDNEMPGFAYRVSLVGRSIHSAFMQLPAERPGLRSAGGLLRTGKNGIDDLVDGSGVDVRCDRWRVIAARWGVIGRQAKMYGAMHASGVDIKAPPTVRWEE